MREFSKKGEAFFASFSIVPVFLKEVFFDFIFFIVWWYTTRIRDLTMSLFNEFLKALERLSLRIFFKNLLKPLYGDYTRTGRAIGIVLRSIIFVVLILTAIVWFFLLIIIFLAWVFTPLIFLYFLLRQII